MIQIKINIPAELSRLTDSQREIESLLDGAVNQAARDGEQILERKATEQLALPQDTIDRDVGHNNGRLRAEVTVNNRPTGLEEYPHRIVAGKTQVQVNPGVISQVGWKRSDGYIYGYKNGRVQRLFGPSVGQVAETEKEPVSKELETQISREIEIGLADILP